MFLYNSLNRKKEKFVPIHPPFVKMYTCGPTVYNFLHVGNFRGPVVVNLLRQWLVSQGYQVTSLMNFTDVDDRIIHKATEEKCLSTDISERYIAEYKTDFFSLGLHPHDANPKVTESMEEIIDLISGLIKKNKAYEVNGDVMYSIDGFSGYGKLSGRKPEDLMAGVRIEVNETKKNPLDFALWKAAKPGEPYWPSPWGNGRPGWHIECSAMVCKHLGEEIDIHGGGMDLIFPHHENEIAQSEAYTEKPLSRFWLHWNMLNFAGQKMSKSLGNFLTLRDFLKKYNSEIYKWLILGVHYRSVCDFSEEAVDRAISGLARIYSAMALAENIILQKNPEWKDNLKEKIRLEKVLVSESFDKQLKHTWNKISESLNDDLNTPEVWAHVFELVRVLNSNLRRGIKTNDANFSIAISFLNLMYNLGDLMALFAEPAQEFLISLDDKLLKLKNLDRAEIQKIVDERWRAREGKDFKKSDELRVQLTTMGISVSDTPQGSYWECTK